MNEQWAQFLKGQEFAGYKLDSLINTGCFSYVFEGTSQDGHKAAVKVLRPNVDVRAVLEFHREGDLLAKLARTSNIVDMKNTGLRQFDLHADGGQPLALEFAYHILELASGCLHELVLNRASLSWVERIKLWRGVVLGVHQMHLRNIVHRDLKSSNCLLFVCGNSTSSKVSDLGRSRDLTSSPSHSADQYLQGLGDFCYAPPEFLYLQGRDTSQTHYLADLYGLGSVLFELATGQSMTATALGFGPDIAHQSSADGLHRVSFDLTFLRGAYTPAFDLFTESLPTALRDRGGRLIRQLCDPLPSARAPKNPRLRKKIGKDKGLEWLLRQADILSVAMQGTTARAESRMRRRGA
jgi:serine/threonine protein kinase